MMKVWANICYFILGGQACLFCKMPMSRDMREMSEHFVETASQGEGKQV